MSDTNQTSTTSNYVTYGGVQDRPDDVNHPDNLETAATSTDPAAIKTVPEGFTYDADTDTYTRSAN